MKKLLLSTVAIAAAATVSAQCTPIDCSATLPNYGGTCDSMLADGNVNVAYSDFESFVLTDNCFDAGQIDPSQSGTDIKILNIDNFAFSGLPAGCTAATNAASYQPPSGSYTTGCFSVNGTPTEIGVFNVTIDFLADVETCGFITITLNDNDASYVLWMTVSPDPTWTIPATSFCETDAAVALTVTGTNGGVFSGPGVSGTSFDPAVAGPGAHSLWYHISAQEGAAIAPASDSLEIIVNVASSAGGTVYADTDNDGFGDPNNSQSVSGCTIPAGYVLNSDDCDDTNNAINPNATDIPDNGVDEDCSGADATTASITEVEMGNVTVFPNPTSGSVTIFAGKDLVNKSYMVINQAGQVVAHGVMSGVKTDINIEHVENGMYFLMIEGTSATTKFVKQ